MKQNLIHSSINTFRSVGMLAGILFSIVPTLTPVSAQITVDDGCLQEVSGFGINCTANDVRLAAATNITIHDDGCAFLGDTVTFTADFEVELTAQARHDIGIYFSRDGDPNGDAAKSGMCTISTIPYQPDLPWLDLDGTSDDPNDLIQDLCGDIDGNHNPLYPTLTLTVQCVDSDGNEELDLPYCTSWRQPGANDLCTTPMDAFPGAPSKCKCDESFNVPIFVPNKQIEVIKELIPSTDSGLFDLQIDGVTEKADASDGDTTDPVTVEAGTVPVGEVAANGSTDLTRYASSIECVERGTTNVVASCTDCTSVDVTVPNTGADYVCTITNDLKQGSITVIKKVMNNSGGDAEPDDFTIFLGDSGNTSFAGEDDPGTTTTLDAGASYNVTENMGSYAGQYTESKQGDCSGTIEASVDKTCTITNTDIAPALTVIKDPTNDDGGNAQPNDFQLTVGGQSVQSGVKNTYTANTPLAINETLVDGYTFVSLGAASGDSEKCPSALGGSVTLALGDDIVCTVKNDDTAPTITLIKDVENDNGGNAGVNAFGLTIGGTSVNSGQTLTVDANQSYALNEVGLDGYSFVSIGAGNGDSAKCPGALGGTVTPDEGENIVCTIKNTDDAPTITLIKDVENDNGGNAGGNAFGLTIGATSVNSGQTLTVDANQAYALDEVGLQGYSFVSIGQGNGDSADCPGSLGGTVTPDEGEDIVCTIKNTDDAPTITLIKDVENDNGGDAGINAFGLTIGATSVNSGQTLTVDANQAYALDEVGLQGYSFVSIGQGNGDSADCPSSLGGTVTPDEGEDIVCTIKNTDDAPTITLIKDVENDNGGNAGVDAFGLTIGATSVDSGQTLTVDANQAYALDEVGLQGYSFVSIGQGNGDSADCPSSLGGIVTPDEGEDIVCTIKNTDDSATITLIKDVENDNGGNAGVNAFGLSIGSTSVNSGQTLTVDANQAYALDEVGLQGYSFVSIGAGAGDSADCPAVLGGTVTPDEGEDIVCTIRNTDDAPTITLIKDVENDNGGNAGVNAFGLTIGATSVNSGQTLTVDANQAYALDEAGLQGYSFVSIGQGNGDSADCPSSLGGTVTPDEGEDIVCTIKNTDDAPTITLIKDVDNGDGGNAGVNAFGLSIGGTSVNSGQTLTVTANQAYALDEVGLDGYTFVSIGAGAGDSAKCPSVLGGTVTPDEGEDIVCTIKNDDIAPKLTLIKDPTNDSGGTALPDAFQLTVGGNGVLSGATNTYMANTPLAINETQVAGYVFVSITGDAECPGVLGGTVTLDEGDDVTCTIKNDDIAPGLTIIKNVVGPTPSSDWDFTAPNLTAQNGFALPAAGGQQTFTPLAGTYTITEDEYNTGNSASEWALTSIECSGAAPASSPDRGVICPLPLAAQAACTFTNQYTEIDLEKSCVSTAPEVGDTVLFSIRAKNLGTAPVAVTLDDDKIPAIDGIQFELNAGDGSCEPDEYLDSEANPAAGGGDGCVEFVEPVVIEMPFFDVENEATLTADQLGGTLSDIEVSLTDQASDVCEVPGPATRTRGFWGNRIGRYDDDDNLIDGFTCYAFENWVLPEYPGGIDLGYVPSPVASCADLSAWFFSHSSRNSDGSRRKRSCQTDYQVSVHLAVLILNTWLPQNADPLPGDTVPVREKDVFDFFPNFPNGDGVPETSMLDLIDLLLSAHRTDMLPDGTPCNSSCKRSLGGYADMIANSGDNEAIIIDGDEMTFGGEYHANPHASREFGELLVPHFDCAVRGEGNPDDDRVITQDPDSPPIVPGSGDTKGDTKTPVRQTATPVDDSEIVVDDLSTAPVNPLDENSFSTPETGEPVVAEPGPSKADLWGPQDSNPGSEPQIELEPAAPKGPSDQIFLPSIRSEDSTESVEPNDDSELSGTETSPLTLEPSWLDIDKQTGELLGVIRLRAPAEEDISSLWLTELEIAVEHRSESDSEWMPAASSAQCQINADLPLAIDTIDEGEREARIDFRCDLGTIDTTSGSELRVQISGRDSSGLELRPLIQGRKL